MDPDNGFDIRIHASGVLQFGIISDGGIKNLVSVSMGTVNTWSCYFCWFDSSAETSYIQRNASAPVSRASTPAPLTYTGRWYIGGHPGDIYWMDGRVQSIAYYFNTILSSDERAFYYNSGLGRTYAEATGTTEIIVQYRPVYQGV